jgi:hypothetical protein
MSKHRLPIDIFNDFGTALKAEEWSAAERQTIEHFLIWAQPYRHGVLLTRAIELYLQFGDTHAPSADRANPPATLKRFITVVGDSLGFYPSAHYRMPNPFLAALLALEADTPKESTHAYVETLQSLVGWHGPEHRIAYADHYYEQTLDTRGVLIHVAERQSTGEDYGVADIKQRITELEEEASAFETLPTDYSKVPNLQKKLTSVVRLLNGQQALGEKPRHTLDEAAEREAIANEERAIGDPPPLSDDLKTAVRQHWRQVQELTPNIRLIRRSPGEERPSSTSDANESRQAQVLDAFAQGSPTDQENVLREITAGTLPDQLKPLRKVLTPILGASEPVVRRRLQGMSNALAKANNPSPTQTTIYTLPQIQYWVHEISLVDAPLAAFLFIAWSTGIHPRRLAPGQHEPYLTVHFDQTTMVMRYKVLNHHAVTADRELPALALCLPRAIGENYGALLQELSKENPWDDLQSRYKAHRTALKGQDIQLPRYLQTWRHSQPALTGENFTRFERHLLRGELPFADWAHSAYVTTDIADINQRYQKCVVTFYESPCHKRLESNTHVSDETFESLGKLDNFPGEAPTGTIGSTYLSDAPALKACVKRLRTMASAKKRQLSGCNTPQKRFQLATDHLNILAMNYLLILLSSTAGRPHHRRMTVDPCSTGLRVEDKDSAHFTEFRVVAVSKGRDWLSGKSLLQQQRNELIKAARAWEALGNQLGQRIAKSGAWQGWEPVFVAPKDGSSWEWLTLGEAQFRRLANEILGIGEIGFRLNHFRHAFASGPYARSDMDRRTLLGHAHPGLEYWSTDSALGDALPLSQATAIASLINEYGLRVICAALHIEVTKR